MAVKAAAAAKRKVDPAQAAYIVGLEVFAGVVESAETDGAIDDQERFASILKHGFANFGLVASELAADEQISKAAISKWMNGKAIPNVPTRKAVLNWLKEKTRRELLALR